MDLNEIKWGCRDDLPEYDISLFVACRALSCLTHPTIKRKSCPLSNVWLISVVLFDTCLTLCTHPQLFSGRVWRLIYNLSQWSAERNEQKHSFIIQWRQMNYFLRVFHTNLIELISKRYTSPSQWAHWLWVCLLSCLTGLSLGLEVVKTLPININTCQSATVFHTHLFIC